jgi:hypothetical protein
MPADPRQTARLRELHQDFAVEGERRRRRGPADLVDALVRGVRRRGGR